MPDLSGPASIFETSHAVLGSGRFKLNKSPQPTLTRHHRLSDARYTGADSSRLRAEWYWLPQVDFRHGAIELASLLAADGIWPLPCSVKGDDRPPWSTSSLACFLDCLPSISRTSENGERHDRIAAYVPR
jgi:hypothetical protein